MDYYYRHAGHRIEYRDGHIEFIDELSGESCSQRIGKIKVTMEEKENEIGIRIITGCSIYNTHGQPIFDDNDVIAKTEYNYSAVKADDQVIYDLKRKYNVSPGDIEIEFL